VGWAVGLGPAADRAAWGNGELTKVAAAAFAAARCRKARREHEGDDIITSSFLSRDSASVPQSGIRAQRPGNRPGSVAVPATTAR
jgi:hypothetical protein